MCVLQKNIEIKPCAGIWAYRWGHNEGKRTDNCPNLDPSACVCHVGFACSCVRAACFLATDMPAVAPSRGGLQELWRIALDRCSARWPSRAVNFAEMTALGQGCLAMPGRASIYSAPTPTEETTTPTTGKFARTKYRPKVVQGLNKQGI
jgi:hypothetical protein